MDTDTLKAQITEAMEEVKTRELTALDVRAKSSVTDFMLVGSGTSNRHLQAIVQNVDDRLSAQGVEPIGREGSAQSDWVLIDYGDVVVHVMLPEAREFYDLEQLWSGATPDSPETGITG